MYIAIEWTSATFHAWQISPAGKILDERKNSAGVNAIQNGAFEAALRQELADWLPSATAILLSGMVTSRTGWVESPFANVPAGLADLLGKSVVRHLNNLPPLYFFPGIAQDHPLPDVMRGEEMSIFGIESPTDGLIILPGPHAKWVEISNGKIAGLATYMSGEILNLLKKDSLLSRLMPSQYTPNPEAFQRGVAIAYDQQTLQGGVLRRLFSARSLVLFGQLQPADIADYLAGLLIGGEIAEALDGIQRPAAISVMGQSPLSQSYRTALAMLQIASPPIVSNPVDAFTKLAMALDQKAKS